MNGTDYTSLPITVFLKSFFFVVPTSICAAAFLLCVFFTIYLRRAANETSEHRARKLIKLQLKETETNGWMDG